MTKVWDSLSDKFDFKHNFNDVGLAGNIEFAWPEIVKIVNSNIKTGARILDFGCGTGGLSNILFQAGYEVVGIDVSEQMILKARELNSKKIQFHTGSFEKLEELGNFDAIVSSMVLQFVKEPDLIKGFSIAKNCLNPRAIVVFAVHNINYAIAVQGDKYIVNQDSPSQININGEKIDLHLRTAKNYRELFQPLGFKEISESYPEYSNQFLDYHYLKQGKELPKSIQKYLIQAFTSSNL